MIPIDLKCNLTVKELILILFRRLENFFLLSEEEKVLVEEKHPLVLEMLRDCFLGVDNKYFKKEGKAYFDYCHSGQYLTYLYLFSKVFSKENHPLKDKFYYLNKIMHSVDIYSEVELPKVFFFEHPLGLVLGRAVYGENFFAMQGCTVGGNKGKYPAIGENVKMYSNSKILGNCKIGDNVWVAANCYIKDCDIPENTIVFGESPNLVFKKIKL